MIVLGEADPDACDLEVLVGGSDGKPFFVAGPHDDGKAVIAQLRRAVGPNGFRFLAPLAEGDLPPGFLVQAGKIADNADDGEEDDVTD